MLFAGLLSAFLVSRASAPFWPPANQPRLPVAVTGLNTGLLVLSGLTMWRVVRLLRQHDKTGAMRWMAHNNCARRHIPCHSGERVGTASFGSG